MKVKKYDQYRKGFPYYKVQYYDHKSKVWREVQNKRFGTEAQARKFGMATSSRHRVVKITREGRRIV